jgi:hypothetical protein
VDVLDVVDLLAQDAVMDCAILAAEAGLPHRVFLGEVIDHGLDSALH